MKKMPNSYMIGAIGILTLLAITIVPFHGESNSNDGKLYGLLTLVQYDENSNEVFSQSTHNRLVDQGETFLLGATFFNNTASPADNTSIGAICIKGGGAIDAASETETAALFESDNTLTGTNCIVDSSGQGVDLTTTQGTAVIGPLTFNEPQHIAATQTILGIGICQSNGAVTPYTGCDNAGILFAIIDTADITLASAETVQITYTFDIRSAGT